MANLTQGTELAFTTPWSLVPDLLAGLEGTHKGGGRYPIPHFLRYTPPFPPTYQKLQELWDEGDAT